MNITTLFEYILYYQYANGSYLYRLYIDREYRFQINDQKAYGRIYL